MPSCTFPRLRTSVVITASISSAPSAKITRALPFKLSVMLKQKIGTGRYVDVESTRDSGLMAVGTMCEPARHETCRAPGGWGVGVLPYMGYIGVLV